MATKRDSNQLESLYEDSIGEPQSADEVYGYWVFALGIIAGFVGIALVMWSNSPGESIRGAGIVLAALGLVLLLIGQVIRLPLERSATMMSYAGAIIGLVAVGWFVVAFNSGNWGSAFAHSESLIIGLYGIGLLVIGAGSVLTPLATRPNREQEAAEARANKAEAKRDAAIEEMDRQEEKKEATAARAGQAESDRDTAIEQRDRIHEELQAAEARAGQAESERDAAMKEIDRQDEEIDHHLAAAAKSDEPSGGPSEELEQIANSQSEFHLYTDEGGDHRWRLRHDNGNIIADSAQGYASRQGAQQGLSAVKRDAFGAKVIDYDKVEATDEEQSPDSAADDEQAVEGAGAATAVDDGASQATFEIYEGEGGDHRWRLRHDNDTLIADGVQGYASPESRDRAVEGIRHYVQSADYLRVDPASFEVYRDEDDNYRWQLLHENGNILADSGQGYVSRQGAQQGLESVRKNVREGGDAEIDIYEDEDGQYRFRLVHRNGNILAGDTQGHATESDAAEAVDRVAEYAQKAHVLDIGTAAFEIYEDDGGQWRWRLRHRNGNIIAESAQGYASRTAAEDGLNSVKQNAPEAETETLA